MKFEGRVVAISGASSGLGRALAVEAARRGARGVALMARREEALAEVASEVRGAGAQALAVATNVQDDASVDAACARVEGELGPIDVAVANAGIGIPMRAAQPDTGLIVKTFDVNVFGAMRLINRALPGMLTRGQGQVAAVSSVAGYRGLPGNGAYSSSKAALSNLMEAITHELGPRGVEVTLIEPGFVKTEMTAKNKFRMPFLLEAAEAARIMADALEAGQPRLVFPWQMAAAMGALRVMPHGLFFKLGSRMLRSREGWDGSDRPPRGG